MAQVIGAQGVPLPPPISQYPSRRHEGCKAERPEETNTPLFPQAEHLGHKKGKPDYCSFLGLPCGRKVDSEPGDITDFGKSDNQNKRSHFIFTPLILPFCHFRYPIGP